MVTDARELIQFKVVVAGAFGAGKTTFIRQISESPVVGTEARTSGDEADLKETTTVGVEYGTYAIDDPDVRIELLLFGLPGQERFEFMWDITSTGMDALVLLIDATRPETWSNAGQVLRHLLAQHDVPFIVGLNRNGDPDLDTRGIATALAVGDVRFATCDVTDLSSARGLLVMVLEDLLQLEEDGGSDVVDDPITADQESSSW